MAWLTQWKKIIAYILVDTYMYELILRFFSLTKAKQKQYIQGYSKIKKHKLKVW